MIRSYQEKDNIFLNEKNPLAVLEILYHKDVIADSIFTSTDNTGAVNGVLYLKYHYTWNGEKENLHFLVPCTYAEDTSVYNALLEYAIEWLSQQPNIMKDKKAALAVWEDSRELTSLQNHMHMGFMEYAVCPCQKYDLTDTIPDYPVPQGFHIEEMVYNPGQVNKFIEATKAANDGTADSAAELWFMSGNPTHKVFLLMDGENIVSSCAVWQISDVQAAIENIFCSPAYRHQNCARAIIVHGLNELRQQGYQFATLSMLGQNEKAGRLYQSLGFELYFNQIELVYPLH